MYGKYVVLMFVVSEQNCYTTSRDCIIFPITYMYKGNKLCTGVTNDFAQTNKQKRIFNSIHWSACAILRCARTFYDLNSVPF